MNAFSQEAQGMSFSSAAYYQLCVLGYIDDSWSGRLGGMTVETAFSADKSPITFLEGSVADQAELIGIVNSVPGHLPLVFVSLVHSH